MTTAAYTDRQKNETYEQKKARLLELSRESKASGIIRVGGLKEFESWLRKNLK